MQMIALSMQWLPMVWVAVYMQQRQLHSWPVTNVHVGTIWHGGTEKPDHWTLLAKNVPNISQSSVAAYFRCGGFYGLYAVGWVAGRASDL